MNSGRIRVGILMTTDLATLTAVWLGSAAAYQTMGGRYEMSTYLAMWPFLAVFALIAGVVRLYHGNVFYPGMALDPVEENRRMVYTVLSTYLLLFAYLTMSRRAEDFSRVVILVSAILNSLLAKPMRDVVRRILKCWNVGQIPALIAGAGRCGRKLADDLKDDSHYGLSTIGFLDDDPAVSDRLGSLDDAITLARAHDTSFLLCCLPPPAVQRHLKDYMGYFEHILLLADSVGLPIAWGYPACVHEIGGVEIRNQLLRTMPRLAKQILEIILAVFGIILLIPVFLTIALLVKLSSRGPVLYRADRLGLHGTPIHVWKFRTMYKNADSQLEQILEKNPELAAEWRANFKLEHDPRITPLGRILRKTSLDELPQFFNVITGELAMIGPRPIVAAEIPYYGDKYETFSRVKPGITGLWQVSGRSETGYERRVSLDMWYIQNWSVWLDIHIFFATFAEVFKCRGAR